MEATTTQPIFTTQPSNAIDVDEQLIADITYMAQLVSRREDIEPLLDVLRSVTSRRVLDQPLSANDRLELRKLEAKIKDYLVSKDPLRAFTRESLAARLQEQRSSGNRVVAKLDTNAKSLAVVWIISILVFGLAFAIPYDLTLLTRFLIGVPLFFTVMHVGLAWFYLSAMRNFNQDMRRVFVYLSAAAVVFSLGFSHYVALALFNLDQYPVFQYGGITWLIAIPFMLIFLGLTVYSRLLGIRSKLLSPLVVVAIVTAVAVVVALLPHTPVDDEFYFDFWAIGASNVALFGILSSFLARKITQSVTKSYANPMKWLYRYTLVVGVTSVIAVVAFMVVGKLHGLSLHIVTASCGIIPQSLLLYTGYLFKKETNK